MTRRNARQFSTPTAAGLSSRSEAIRRLTAGQRWRLRRDLVIHVAAGQGVSQRLLADVFDLPHSRINAILKAMKATHAGTKDDEAEA